MIDQDNVQEILAAVAKRRDARRNFLKVAGSGTAAVGGLALLSACGGGNDNGSGSATPTPTPTATATSTPTPTANLDFDILNFALNLEYLEAQFYSYAVNGAGLSTSLTQGGSGAAPGTVTGGAQVDFSGDALVGAYAREIAQDEADHVRFLRLAIGSSAVAMPNINISGDANGAFTAAARAAGVVGAGDMFNPYASPEAFLLGAYIFEDVGVSAYKGAAPLITSKAYLEAAAGILAAEAYHAGLVRTVLYAKGIATPSSDLIANANKISDARDSLDGTTGATAERDQGITLNGTTANNGDANIVPADANAIAYSRSPSQVLNIVYLNTAAKTAGASMGGFFPNGLNANLAAFKTSTANP
ncbi:ferritin-like domain-containing protein [Sphingomonas hylomeconis]|uniref:Ferritin-like domain-containing protein n=1 Tax=Sphingomonas hylomeconis TaxID=1395958 RepID=A0ABV7ST70_9SPHN|nr:ferritin-like domain-containing protein [Sphingomonas hylomeconis]